MKSVQIAALIAASGTAVTATAKAQTPALSYYFPSPANPPKRNLEADICIYGGNASGVVAALQASRMGKKAIVLEPSEHVGGLSSGGLGETDIGNKAAIGGISQEFYRRVGQKYGLEQEWRFEPRIAEQVFKEMLQEAKAPVYYRQFLQSVEKKDGKIASITLESGLNVRAKMFIDASYEGDLMAKSGVKYHVGRESNATYGENYNGVQVHQLHQFDLPVDPYIEAGNPNSGLLPSVNATEPGPVGTGDNKIQAYNFRLCLTNDPSNRIPYEKPAGYDPQQYVLLGRYLKAGWPESEVFRKFDPIHNSTVPA
ncbi:FAD-dependent oxidoreductase, partial [bacterium]